MALQALKLPVLGSTSRWLPAVIVLLITVGRSELAAEDRIVFHSNRVGNGEIYVIDINGANLVRLTRNPASDSNPACSPDGRKIAFVSNRAGSSEIFAMDPDGTSVLRLTSDLARATDPCWSRDGSKIAFSSSRDGNPEIYVMDSDGKNLVRLTHHGMRDDSPSWSPDGGKIAFESSRDGGMASSDIFVMDADGKNLTNLTINPEMFLDRSPAWSPDGDRIAFQTRRNGDLKPEVYVMNPKGKMLMRLTDGKGGSSPAWSPDGNKVAFTSNRDGDWNIHIMDADGQNIVRLTETVPDAWDGSPCWLPESLVVSTNGKEPAIWGAVKHRY